ncbi:MAG TPA: B12-binding domain-containing protein [Ktedonobacterales bacterium]|nr:B12-binding domain-containing protein [Ktedonobacterales bacterium]
MEPPILSQYSDVPVYEVTTMVQLLKVRPLALWTWEQHLGISNGDPNADSTRQKRRYSERDLAALMWLRDRIIAGESPQDATARLLGAQRGMRGLGYGVSGALSSGPLFMDAPNQAPGMTYDALNSGALNSGALNSGALGMQPPAYDPMQQYGREAPWVGGPSGNLGAATYTGGMNTSSMRATSPARMVPQDPFTHDPWSTGGWNQNPMTGQRVELPPVNGPIQTGGPSGRLGSVYSAALEPPSFPQREHSVSQSLSSIRELRPAVPQLLQAFARFDTARAQAVMSEALRLYGVENVCIGLVQPAIVRISELWSKSELSNPEERFGLNYLRGFMFNVFQTTQEPMGAPFVVVGSAPNETSDFAALLLAVLWRRAGLRVAYLGRGIDADQLLQEPWPVTPAVVALTATSSQRIRALARIGKKLSEMPPPQPTFAYWGPIFVRNPDLRRKLSGVYLGDDATTAIHQGQQIATVDLYGE